MKKRIAILLSFALMFTSVFGMGVSYAGTEEGEDFNMFMEFCPGEDWAFYGGADADAFEQAKTEEGAILSIPYGYVTDLDEQENYLNMNLSLMENSDIASLHVDGFETDEEGNVSAHKAYLKDLVEDGKFTLVVDATMKNGEVVTYTFHYVEDEGDATELMWLYMTYYDENGNEQSSESVILQDSFTTLKDGVTLELPYFYDNTKGFSFQSRGSSCIIKNDFAEKYTLTNDKASFTVTFSSANGKQQTTVPFTVTRDTDGSKAELDSFSVNVYQYWDSDDSYVDEYIDVDSFAVNAKNEIYVAIPSEYQCYYYDDDSFCEWVNIENIGEVTLSAYAKDGARFKVVDSEGWTNMQDWVNKKVEGYGYEGCVEDDVVLEVHSPNGKVINTYTIKVIVSDCDGYHTFSAWQADKAPTCTEKGLEAHKCKYCPYKEYREVAAKGHTPGATATCTTAQKCKNCSYQYAPAKGHDIVVDKAVAATCTTSGLTEGKHCTRCDYKVAQQTVAAKGHTPGVAATCTTPQNCTTCNAQLAPAKGHTPGAAATCTTPQVCTACQAQLAPATGHSATAPIVTKATVKADGSIVIKCGCGEVLSTEVIKAASKVSLSKAAYTYTGKKVKAPKVVVKDADGKVIPASQYKVTAPKNVKKMKDIGRYTWTVKFTGDKYTGSQKVSMEIKPAKTTIKAPVAVKKAITVKWTKGKKAQVTGYEVLLATNKNFTKGNKTVTVKGYSKTSKKVTRLKTKTKYFVKVRTYKIVKGAKIYSDWSKVKQIKTK